MGANVEEVVVEPGVEVGGGELRGGEEVNEGGGGGGGGEVEGPGGYEGCHWGSGRGVYFCKCRFWLWGSGGIRAWRWAQGAKKC